MYDENDPVNPVNKGQTPPEHLDPNAPVPGAHGYVDSKLAEHLAATGEDPIAEGLSGEAAADPGPAAEDETPEGEGDGKDDPDDGQKPPADETGDDTTGGDATGGGDGGEELEGNGTSQGAPPQGASA
jgi:hypothetical protein